MAACSDAFNPMIQLLRPDLADRLDPARDPLVRRRRRLADTS
jgi:hypothetical protein